MTPQQKYKLSNPDKIREQAAAYYAQNKERIQEYRKVRRAAGLNDTSGTRNSRYKHKYGITLAEYEAMVSKQHGLCAICHQEEVTKTADGRVASLCVDHCHKTGTVRGLLCRSCNAGLGKLKDDKQLLLNAIRYLDGNHHNEAPLV
jgi:hypothetical protein